MFEMYYLPPKKWNYIFFLFSLSEVGRLEAPKLEGNYDTGQLFLHKVLGDHYVVSNFLLCVLLKLSI